MTTVLERPTSLRQSKSALHVEDDERWRSRIGRYLQEVRYDVTQVDNQEEAEELAHRQPFDVYIFDEQFPLRRGGTDQSGSGIDLYDKIREIRGVDLNCVIVSGGNLRRQCNERGIKFIYKGLFDRGSFMTYLKKLH